MFVWVCSLPFISYTVASVRIESTPLGSHIFFFVSLEVHMNTERQASSTDFVRTFELWWPSGREVQPGNLLSVLPSYMSVRQDRFVGAQGHSSFIHHVSVEWSCWFPNPGMIFHSSLSCIAFFTYLSISCTRFKGRSLRPRMMSPSCIPSISSLGMQCSHYGILNERLRMLLWLKQK